MAKKNIAALGKKPPASSNRSQKVQKTNGALHPHKHGNGQDTADNTKKKNDSKKKTKGTINWFSHWGGKNHDGKDIIVDFPHHNCTKVEFKKLVKNYAKAWLDMYNIYLPKEKRNKLIMGKFNFEFEEKIPGAEVKTYKVKVKAYLDPDPELEKEFDRPHTGTGDVGAGHLIPPEPPPPPPDSSVGG